MMNITISFDNVNEAMVAINAVQKFNEAAADFTDTVAVEAATEMASAAADSTPAPNTDEITASDIGAIIDKLIKVYNDGVITDIFGDQYNKPYRVLKAFDYKTIKDKLGIGTTSLGVMSDINDVKAAIDIIIKDVSVGGLSHNQMEELFDVRTSAKLFEQNSLDEIVEKLKGNDLI